MIELSLKNFKGVRDGELKLPKVSLLIGGNNSGKTTILEALFLASDPLRRTVYGIPALEVVGKVHRTLREAGYLFLINYYVAEHAEIDVTIGDKNSILVIHNINDYLFLYSLILDEETQKPESAFSYGYASKFADSLSRRGPPPHLRERYNWVSELPSMPEVLLYHPALRKLAWDRFQSRWSELMPITPKIASELSSISWERMTNITLEPFGGSPTNLTLYAMFEGGMRVRLGDLGDGIQSLATLMLLYEISKPDVILIDDLESHMNPRALDFLFSWLLSKVEQGKYLITSTHSLDVAKRFLSFFEDEGAKAVLLGLKDGILKHKILSLEDVEELEQAGVDVRVAEPYLL